MKLKENNARGDGGWTLEGDFGKKMRECKFVRMRNMKKMGMMWNGIDHSFSNWRF